MLHAIIHGRVQGVCFRAWTLEQAQALGLKGWVRNLPNQCVEVLADGPAEALEKFSEALHHGPPAARVDRVDLDHRQNPIDLEPFRIRHD